MQVRCVLFPRREIAAIGIAPLTSMYFFGPERRAGVDDFRDAVHDSDGLRMVNGSGERLWRPLRNPPSVADLGLRRREPALLRPDPARPRLRALPGRRGPLRARARAPGSSRAKAGAAARSCWSSCRAATSSPTTSSPSGGPRRRCAPESRAHLHLPPDLGARPSPRSCRSPASSPPAAASRSSTPASGSSSSTSTSA